MKRLLLVGAGIPHLHFLNKLINHPIKDVEVTLLAPNKFQYVKEMLPGYAEGTISIDDARINVEQLAHLAKVTVLKHAILSVDVRNKKGLTSQGQVVSFDVISFAINALTEGTEYPDIAEHVTTLYPNANLMKTIENLQTTPKLAIVGNDELAVEMTLGLQTWRIRQQKFGTAKLISPTPLLPNKDEDIVSKATDLITSRDISLHINEPITKVSDKKLVSQTKREFTHTNTLWLTAPRSPKFFKQARLSTDHHNFLLVEETLQVKSFPFVFGAGECVSISAFPNDPKNLVSGIKQGDTLWENIRGYFGQGDGYLYQPPKRDYSVLSVGNKKGLFQFNNKVVVSRLAWHTKNRAYKKIVQGLKP